MVTHGLDGAQDVRVDNTEVHHAHWFSCDELVQVYHETGRNSISGQVPLDAALHPQFAELTAAGRGRVSTSALAWVASYAAGYRLPVEVLSGTGPSNKVPFDQLEHGVPVRVAIGGKP